MKLKKIEAYGFKSFADKISIDIKDGITGIVGPNGSGKSNIVDSVKWVMGEQSVKALRGSNNMSDVIFQGSASRKPLTRASVTLVIDNEDHYLHSDFKDIEIKRTVYSSGDNEYTINGAKVRLKDITDLFLDSGAGKEAFSIISQGKIGEILNGKPQDRRLIIEEAAGVLKYKKRKIESLKKLEKTNDNLSKVNLVINELDVNLEPLKKQAIEAKKAKELKEELANNEIALLTQDITDINKEYEALKETSETLRKEIENLEKNNSNDDAKEEKLKLELIKLENELNEKSKELLKLTEEISTLMSNRQVIVERKKYEVDDIKLEGNIIALKESILSLKNEYKKYEDEIKFKEEDLEKLCNKQNELIEYGKKQTAKRNNLNSEITLKNRILTDLKNKIDITISNIENSSLIPYSVKTCLDNPRLKGLHGTIGNLIEIDDEYNIAIDTALGANQNVIVCDNENNAKEAINYLKDNKLGRATFFPINIIKPKNLNEKTYDLIKKEPGFIDIASNLVKNDSKYENIIASLLGNVIVARDIDSMNRIGKIINYTNKIVTLDGEILHTGGSLTGGKKQNTKNTISEKAKLETLKDNETKISKDIDRYNNEINILENNLKNNTEELQDINIKINTLVESIKNKKHRLEEINNDIKNKELELNGTNNLKASKLDEELELTLNKYYEKIHEKESLETTIENLKSRKSILSDEIREIQLNSKKANFEYNKKVNTLKEAEIKLGKLDIKLDNLLLHLTNEYDITYERAKLNYPKLDNINEVRKHVDSIKSKLRSLGDVNYGAIDEYNRINERYTFLTEQKNDLQKSVDDLLNVINEMDETMKQEFKTTFDKVNIEFKNVFNKLFKGGHGELLLTDPDNILETGIDIIAEPPGKKLRNITLLSGGEKTLTAISLLFAVLNIKVVPFCILDEVEAALDDANVATFGEYLKEYENKTQFIVITHKKRTMEYANTLYGITMQESGVSKLVSVKLEGIK